MEPTAPDAHIEEFWIGCKDSMINFYKWSGQIQRPLDVWSHRLNSLQSQRKYEQIEKCILNYLSSYALDMMRYGNRYHADILDTNLRRWNRLSLTYNFFFKRETNQVMMLFEIFVKNLERGSTDFTKELCLLFQQVELFIFTDDYFPLVELALKYGYPSIIDTLRSRMDVAALLSDNLHLAEPLPRNLAGRKIVEWWNSCK